MNQTDRVMAALCLEEPDRVPIGEQIYDAGKVAEALGRLGLEGSAGSEAGTRMARIKRQVDDLTVFIEKMDVDIVPTKPSPPLSGTAAKWLDKETWVDEWGAKYRLRDGISWYVGPALNDIREIGNLVLPDPEADGVADEAEMLVKRFKGERAIVGTVPGEKLPYLARGINGYVVDLYRNFPFAKRFMEMATEYNVGLGKRLIEAGVDFVCITGDVAGVGGPLFSIKHFKEVFAPATRRIVSELQKCGVPVIKHTDGFLEPILDDLVSTGIDGLQSIEPAAGMDIGSVKARYGDRICLWGNMDLSYTLALGTPAEVQAEVKRCIRAAAGGGGHILSSSNSYSSAMKFENFKAMVEAGRKYGKYPPLAR